MIKYIALLRGINVSGKNKIKMESLQLMMKELGFTNVATYIQSGNIVFESSEKSTSKLALHIGNAIQENFNLDVPVLVMQKAKFTTGILDNPFLKDKEVSFLHLTVLFTLPEQVLVENVDKINYPDEQFKIINNFIFLFTPNGYGNAKLNNSFWERKIKG